MKIIKLTEEQKEKLVRPNGYIAAVFGEGIEWSIYTHFEDGLDINELNGPLPAADNGWDRKNELDQIDRDPGFDIICDTAEKIVKNSEDDFLDELYCDECTGNGYLYVNYDGETMTFSTRLEKYVRYSQDSKYMKTFQEWGNMQPEYPWQKFTYLKKLLDPEFIEKYKNEGEGGVFELIYNGGGDSGQFDEPIDIPRDIEYLGYEIIDVYHSGWENNEGADGRIVIDFNERTIALYHQHYYKETEEMELEKYQLV